MRSYIGSYLKKRYKTGLLYMALSAVFAVVFYLSNIPVDAAAYAFLLAGFFFVVAGVLDYINYCRKLKILETAKDAVTVELKELPRADDGADALYQDMLNSLFDFKSALEVDASIGKQDMIDYYSLWVHQIKTPISAMRLLLQSKEEEHSESDKQLRMELFKVEQYVEMVLSYIRMEDMSSDMILQWYELDGIIRQSVRKYSQMFILKKISLEFTETAQRVLTDEKWILVVIEQILSNALKYTKEGSIRIYMHESEKMTLVIEDTGSGIWEEDIPRVFDKGFTGYNGRTDKKSTGIGLYLCKKIIDKLGHSIRITSKVSEGTKVYLGLYRKTIDRE